MISACTFLRTSGTEYSRSYEEEYNTKPASYDDLKNERKLKKKFKRVGLSYFWPETKKLLRKEIRIETKFVTEGNLALGQSKIGGNPDLPADMEWPQHASGAMLFLAQIDLSEINKSWLDIDVPETGILYFFVSQRFRNDSYEPEPSDYLCLYKAEVNNLVRRAHKPYVQYETIVWNSCELDFKNVLSLPPQLQGESLRYEDDENDTWTYYLMQSVIDDHVTKLGGYANDIQGEMEKACEYKARGYDRYGDIPRTERVDIVERSADWVLLFQLDSDSNAGMEWSDRGKLFFWIRKDDLKGRRFDKVYMIIQNY